MKALTEFKKEFSSREGIHFNNAGRAPTSRSVSERLIGMVSDGQIFGSLNDAELVASIGDIRSNVARFLNADVDSVGFTANVASALSQVALGFPLRAGDEVVVLDQEYASNFYPWKVACERSGAQLKVIASGNELASGDALSEKVINAITSRTKIMAVSWVQFQTGAMLDLNAIGIRAHSVGAHLVVDVIQGLGQIPFSFRDLPVDFIACGSHKWMCGTLGQGFLAAKKNFLDQLSPTVVGCGTFNRFGTFADVSAVMETSARKFEPGGFAFLSLFGLDSAVSVLSRVGVDVVNAEVVRLSTLLRHGLREIPGVRLVTPIDQQNGITSFVLPLEKEVQLLQRCKEAQIAIAKRGEFVRVSIHAFCNELEVERFLGMFL